MRKYLYSTIIAAVTFGFTACDDNDDFKNIGMLDGIEMITRSVSVVDGSVIRPISAVTVDYNNLVGIDATKSVTINGSAVAAYVNPDNGMQLVIPVTPEFNREFVVVVPDGFVYRADDATVTNPGLSVSFSTYMGLNLATVATELTNSNATAQAKALYSELLSNYGKYMYSGAMGGVAWETGFTDFIAANNGGVGYPKIVGFDYIHLPYSGEGSWINYGDITPVKSAWEAGSIPAVTWHWVVPGSDSNEITTDVPKEMPSDWSGFLQIPANYFTYAKEGDYVTVTIDNVAENAQGSFKNGSTWSGLTETVDGNEVSYEYFDINDVDEEGNITTPSVLTLYFSPEILEAVKGNGLIISGHSYTVQSVTFSGDILGTDLSYNNNFSPSKALTAGTPQNAVINADIEKLAGYLSLLQDAGIPVLFRPLHEAAGDYAWGPWFWWGNDGVDATKQLWSYLRNKLQNEYGLNNLIWVWTVQTSEAGQPASVSTLRSAYPGDNLVDIVGCDLYPDSPLSDQTSQFDLINSMVERRKMIALCEVGNLIDPSFCIENNALWSYFMNWYDADAAGVWGFNNWNYQPAEMNGISYNNVWEAVSNSPYVVNR